VSLAKGLRDQPPPPPQRTCGPPDPLGTRTSMMRSLATALRSRSSTTASTNAVRSRGVTCPARKEAVGVPSAAMGEWERASSPGRAGTCPAYRPTGPEAFLTGSGHRRGRGGSSLRWYKRIAGGE